MNLAFLLPAAFAALAALLVPLLIHLARRSKQRPTDFAALRWLRAKPRPRHRIRFDEWPLLLLRLLLLVALAMLLAKPVLLGSASHAPWVAVVPGVDPEFLQRTSFPPDARWHWLAPGFPELDQTDESGIPGGPLAISSLLRELDASLPADVPLTVLVPARLSGVDAQRPVLGRRVEWRVVPGAMPVPAAARIEPVPMPAVRYAPDRADAVRYLRAAAAAWSAPGGMAGSGGSRVLDVAPVSRPLDARVKHLVWLAPGPLPAAVRDWIANGGVALLDRHTAYEHPEHTSVFWRDGFGVPLVEGAALGRGRVMRFTRPFAPQAMPQLLEPDFPTQLHALFAMPAPAPTRVLAIDHAPLPGGPVFAQPPRDLQPWWLWCIVFLFGLERWLATGPRRGVGA